MIGKSMQSREACEVAYRIWYARATGLERVALDADGKIVYGPGGRPVFKSMVGAFMNPNFEGVDDIGFWYLGDPILEAEAACESSEAATEVELYHGIFLRAPAGLTRNLALAWMTPTGHRVYYFQGTSPKLYEAVAAWRKTIDFSVTAIPDAGRWHVWIVFPHEPSGPQGRWAYADRWEPAARPWEWWPEWLKAEMRARGYREPDEVEAGTTRRGLPRSERVVLGWEQEETP